MPRQIDDRVEQQQDRRPEEASLLGERREDEVRVMLGQVVEVRLLAPAMPAPVEPAGADRGDRPG